MTRKEQIKILDDKIKTNKRQYDLDRINAKISAYSSGDLSKYEYLTKKDLGYKPDAFEQSKFQYSLLGKVFTDGLTEEDKSNKIGLLKRLKNIEDNFAEANDDNKLVNILDKYDEYKTIQNFKKELIDKNILHIDGVKKFDNIVNKWKQTKDKENVYINNKNKYSTRKFDIYNIFKEYLNEIKILNIMT